MYTHAHTTQQQSQPISAVLPDVKQVEVQRPHAPHHQQQHQQQAAKKQSVDLMDLLCAPSSPERPAQQQHQQQAGGFASDPFASQAGPPPAPSAFLSGSLSASQGKGRTETEKEGARSSHACMHIDEH